MYFYARGQRGPTTPCANGANDNTQLTLRSYNSSNRDVATGTPLTYDGAGNVTTDQQSNQYLYDPEGRLCAVKWAGSSYTQYLYDAEGRRIGKVSPQTLSCAAPTGLNSRLTNHYLYDLGGQPLTELSIIQSNGRVIPSALHTNVYVGSHLLATYNLKSGNITLHFPLTDPLGTKRVQAAPTGTAELTCTGLPFGNEIGNSRTTHCVNVSPSTAPDDTEQHFTGKERDTESGNDYFGARYYASAMGRWMSPDWSAKAEPVPYAKLDNPQSLNLYAYVGNNPLTRVDADGHCPECVTAIWGALIGGAAEAISEKAQGNDLNSGKILFAAAGGGFAGAIAGPLANAVDTEVVVGFLAKAGANALGSAVGGAVERKLTGRNPLDRKEIFSDVGAGAISHGLGKAIESPAASQLVQHGAQHATDLVLSTAGRLSSGSESKPAPSGGHQTNNQTPAPSKGCQADVCTGNKGH